MKKIMILGSAGMLGHMVYYYLKSLDKYYLVDASFPSKMHKGSRLLDVTIDSELVNYIQTEKPDAVVNCIGVLIKDSQTDPSNAIYLNAYLPHRLTKILRNAGGMLIHMSTDCVFSGKKGNYTEDDFRDADDIYGRSKALGEVINDTDVTLRTSIIGPELKENGVGLFHWFMQQNGRINGYANTFWSGVTTLQLAKVIDYVINSELKGLIHVTNGQKISKYNLLKAMNEIWNKKIAINPVEVKNEDKSLRKSKILKYKIPDYKQMLLEQKNWILENREIHNRYI